MIHVALWISVVRSERLLRQRSKRFVRIDSSEFGFVAAIEVV